LSAGSRFFLLTTNMPKTRQKKEQDSKRLEELLQGNTLAVISTFEGVKVKDSNAFRKELRSQQAELVVTKKTILTRALKNMHYDGFEPEKVQGMMGIAFSQDEVTAAKLIKTFSKDRKIVFAAGFLEGKYLTAQEVEALADLPSREMLLARTVGALKSPVSGFVQVLRGTLQGLVYALKGIADKKPVS